MDVSETPKRILIRLEVAGVKPGEFAVVVERDVLTVRGRRCDIPPDEKEEYHAKEIRYGCFERAFRLPRDVLADEIQATYRDGFLEVEIPKGEGKTRSIQIPVQED